MKNILISTDFSPTAAHAAAYGYNLAKQSEANILLANAITLPAEVAQPGMVVLPIAACDEMDDYSVAELQKLKAHLEQNDYSDTFRPSVNYFSETGRVTDVINHVADKEIGLIVIGKHAQDRLSTFLLGNHCSNLIDTVSKPLLVIPPKAAIKQIKKIAFAFDFNHIATELTSIYELIAFAKTLNADVLLTHIFAAEQSPSMKVMIDELLTDAVKKAHYPNIYYRTVTNDNIEQGLNWFCEHEQIDVLAMNHGPYSFIDDVLKLSHTQKMAENISIPLLVYQAGN
nr:universal stress protein [uncultured Mucilaginibacter sp.]